MSDVTCGTIHVIVKQYKRTVETDKKYEVSLVVRMSVQDNNGHNQHLDARGRNIIIAGQTHNKQECG